MEKTIFQGEECYIAYKGLKKDLTNFQNNYKYEPGYWYKTLNVDMEDDDCSYGLNLAVDYWSGICFGGKVFKAYVPIKNNKIKLPDSIIIATSLKQDAILVTSDKQLLNSDLVKTIELKDLKNSVE